MPLRIWEAHPSRELDYNQNGGSSPRIYNIDGTDDEIEAITALAQDPNGSPLTIPDPFDPSIDLVRSSLSVKKNGSNTCWIGTAEYQDPGRAPPKVMVPGQIKVGVSFDTSGSTQKIKCSKQGKYRSYGAGGGTAPDFKGLINVSRKDGKIHVEGVDIPIAGLKFSVRASYTKATFGFAFVNQMKQLTKKKNAAAWGPFAAGEVMFLGMTGAKESDESVELDFHFEAIENISSLLIDGVDSAGAAATITVATKKGHEYLWIYYIEVQDTTANMMVARPHAAYVHDDIEDGDFTNLGF